MKQKIPKQIWWALAMMVVFLTLLSPAVPKFLSRHGLLLNGIFMHSILFSSFYLLTSITWKNPITQLLLVILLSVLTEYLQLFTGRSFETEDLLANGIGVFAGFAAYQLAEQVWARRILRIALV